MIGAGKMSSNVDLTDEDDAQPNQCTDVCCLIIFLLYVGLMAHVQLVAVANPNADWHKLTNGIDWQGKTCGVGNKTDFPYLYWCVNLGNGHMSLTDGICVDTCPRSDEGSNQCPLKPEIVESTPPPSVMSSGDYEYQVTLTREVKELRNVPTFGLMDMYCVPSNIDKVAENFFTSGPLSGASEHVVIAAHGAYDARFVLVFVGICVLIMSFGFLYVLTFFVEVVIVVVIAVVFLGLLGIGSYFTYSAFNPARNIFHYFFPGHAMVLALSLGAIFYLLEMVFICFIIFSREAVEVTCDAVRKACETIQKLPTLLMGPVISLILKGILLYWLWVGLGNIASQGQIVPATSPYDTSAGVAITGVMRKIDFESWMYTHMAIWAFGSIWILEIIVALGQYSISHAVVMFHLNRDESCNLAPITTGMFNGIFWHLGTLAFGAFVIGVLRVFTMVCAFIAKQTKAEDGSTAVAFKVACCCCTCCLKFLTTVMRMTNEMAYVDTAIQGSDYPVACKNVAKMALDNPVLVANLTGLTKAMRVLGTLSIGFIGTFFAHWLFTSEWLSGELNALVRGAGASLGTSSTLGATIAAAMISFGIGTSFMISFDTITDTLAYCIMWQKHINPDGTDDYAMLKPED